MEGADTHRQPQYIFDFLFGAFFPALPAPLYRDHFIATLFKLLTEFTTATSQPANHYSTSDSSLTLQLATIPRATFIIMSWIEHAMTCLFNESGATGPSFNTTSITHFPELPRELRNRVYHHALVQQEPIEFAPLGNCRETYEDPERRFMVGGEYHTWRYENVIAPSLALLRVSKQMYSEAAKVYYERNEFRFSGAVGWQLLGQW